MCAAWHNSKKWLHNHQRHQSPPPANFDIVDIAIGNRGRSCKKHSVCGVQVEEGIMVRLKREMILVDGLEEVVI
jgi:hypothetical protein